MSINHTKYDRDDFDPNYPLVNEAEECHVVKQYMESWWPIAFNVACGLVISIGLAGLVCEFMGWTKYLG